MEGEAGSGSFSAGNGESSWIGPETGNGRGRERMTERTRSLTRRGRRNIRPGVKSPPGQAGDGKSMWRSERPV